MRGWLHTYAFFVFIAAGIGLCVLATGAIDAGRVLPLVGSIVYGLTVCGLLGTSALFHRRAWSPRWYRIMQRLDHSMIFVLIAGTYTPLCLLLPSRALGMLVLAVVWTGAAIGVGIKVFAPSVPRWLSTLLYLALGWAGVVLLPDLARAGGNAVLVLTIAGGAIYTLGAVFYALRRPNPWPATFGHHEVFHACTVVAAACHYIAICLVLAAT